jgi:glyoxylate/hydroxypyruvate reductase A
MALLIDIKHPDWMQDDELRSELLGYYPEADIRIGADPGNPAEIEMLTVSAYHPGEALRYPNLQVIQKTGAGVNNILADEDLPESIQVVRLQTDTSGAEMRLRAAGAASPAPVSPTAGAFAVDFLSAPASR